MLLQLRERLLPELLELRREAGDRLRCGGGPGE